jgi:hypothetical protein
MDDDKSITEKLTDAIGKATDSVKSTMSNLVDTASQAAQYAMESNAEKISRQTFAVLDPAQIAAMTDGRVYNTEAADAVMPAPLVFAPPVSKTKRKPRAKNNLAKVPAAEKPVAKKAADKAAKKTARKPAKKSVAKSSKKAAKNSTGKKTAKRAARKAKKSTAKKKRSKR